MPNVRKIRSIHSVPRTGTDHDVNFIALDPDALVNIDVACKTLAISKKTLYKYCEQGQIEHYSIGRRLRFDRGGLSRFLEKHKVKLVNSAVGGGK